MYHYAYLLTFKDGKQYVGARSTHLQPELDTTYLGSGRALPKDRHDTRNVQKIILKVCTSREELMQFEKEFIISNNCVSSENWLNQRIATFDRHGSEPWNKGKPGLQAPSRETYKQRYGQGFRTPAQIAGAQSMREKLTGVKNPGKAHPSTDNCAFKPWYYITTTGDYVEVHDKTKEEAAPMFGISPRQLGHRFHHTNIHRPARYKSPIQGYVFGNLPRPTETALA